MPSSAYRVDSNRVCRVWYRVDMTTKAYALRLPQTLYDEIALLAEQEHRSVNSQIVSLLESGLTAPPSTAPGVPTPAKRVTKKAQKRAPAPPRTPQDERAQAQGIVDRVLSQGRRPSKRSRWSE